MQGSGGASVWTTRANALTGLRLLLAPALAAAVLAPAPLLALVCFSLAAASDFADGWVARRYREVTPFGGFADHAVDAIFVSLGTAALASRGLLPAVLPPLIALAFVQYSLDSKVLRGAQLRSSLLGRWNGIAYYGIISIPIVRDAFGLAWPGAWTLQGMGWVLVVSTLLSMGDRGVATLRASRRRDA